MVLCRNSGGGCEEARWARNSPGRALLSRLTGGTEETGFGTVWGRGAASSFDGREGELTLNGEVRSAMFGVDWVREKATAGLVVAHSRGEGGYRSDSAGGEVESTLTGLYPYGRYAASEQVSVWGVAGYGAGTLTLEPEGARPIETDMDLAMAAAGLRAVAVRPGEGGGPELAVTADALAVRTTYERARGSGGHLAPADADVTRLTLGIEGRWHGVQAGGGRLVPSLEIGARHDGGDAETGFGVDLGAGIAWSHPERGLEAELRGRELLTHEDSGFRERTFTGTLTWDPDSGSKRGLSFKLAQTVGTSATGAMDALLSRRTMAVPGANDEGDGSLRHRLDAKLGYGIGVFGGRFVATPEVGAALSESDHEVRLGWRLGLARSGRVSIDLDLEATRRESTTGDRASGNGIGLSLTARW